MSRSSVEATGWRDSRGQVHPIAALVALTAVGMGLALYAGAIGDVTPDRNPDRDRALLLFERVHDDVVAVGVARPNRLGVPDAAPANADVGVALVSGEKRWTAGTVDTNRPFPPDADVATGAVSVRVGPGETRAGELRVVVRP